MEEVTQQSRSSDEPISGTPEQRVIGKIDRLEQQLAQRLTTLKKLKDLLSKTRTGVETRNKPISTMTAFVSQVRSDSAQLTSIIDVSDVIHAAEAFIKSLQSSGEAGFAEALLSAAETQMLDVRSVRSGYVIGPFELNVNAQKESGKLRYAHDDVCDVPLDPNRIVKQVVELQNTLLRKPDDMRQLAEQMAEAIRVSVARQQKLGSTEPLRAELPAVFREMCSIRRVDKRSKAAAKYARIRFIVELKSLVESDQNISSKHRFRLEAAVVENAKTSKSIFIPADLQRGAGEGMYYQAISLVP